MLKEQPKNHSGGADTLRRSRPRLIIELHKGEENVECILKKFGYKVAKPSKYFIIAHSNEIND